MSQSIGIQTSLTHPITNQIFPCNHLQKEMMSMVPVWPWPSRLIMNQCIDTDWRSLSIRWYDCSAPFPFEPSSSVGHNKYIHMTTHRRRWCQWHHLVVAILETEHESVHQLALIGAVCQWDGMIALRPPQSNSIHPLVVMNSSTWPVSTGDDVNGAIWPWLPSRLSMNQHKSEQSAYQMEWLLRILLIEPSWSVGHKEYIHMTTCRRWWCQWCSFGRDYPRDWAWISTSIGTNQSSLAIRWNDCSVPFLIKPSSFVGREEYIHTSTRGRRWHQWHHFGCSHPWGWAWITASISTDWSSLSIRCRDRKS